MNKILKIIIGLILIIIPLYLIFPGNSMDNWGIATPALIKGGITLLVLFIGIILIILGINDLKN